MLPDRVSNPGPLTYESGALPIALHGPAPIFRVFTVCYRRKTCYMNQLFKIISNTEDNFGLSFSGYMTGGHMFKF